MFSQILLAIIFQFRLITKKESAKLQTIFSMIKCL